MQFQNRSLSCPPLLIRCQSLHDPSALIIKQLQEIARNYNNTQSEDHNDYKVGGYMPISLGQTIGPNSRYRIIRKLGWGSFSTVWLCNDMMRNDAYYALKVVKASTPCKYTALDEIELLRCARNNEDPDNIGYNRVILLRTWFIEHSINGSHICLTFEIMGPSLFELLIQSNFEGIDQQGVKIIIEQVLEGLVFLHEKCRIIHTDIKPENILVTVNEPYVRNMVDYVKRFSKLGVQMPKSYVSAIEWKEHVELYDQPGGSKTSTTEPQFLKDCSWPDNYYKQMSKSSHQRHNNGSPSLLFIDPNTQVKIADLGNGCWEDKHFASVIQTVEYRALEVIIGADYSFPVDIWSVACVAFEISTGKYLFHPQSAPHLSAAEDHLRLMWEVLDGIPKYVALSGKQSKNYFDSTGALKHIKPETMKIWKIEDELVGKHGWERVKAIMFANFLQALIEPDPELRATASAALNHEWLQEIDN